MGQIFHLGSHFRGKFLYAVGLAGMYSNAVDEQFLGLCYILPAAGKSQVLAINFLQHQILSLFCLDRRRDY